MLGGAVVQARRGVLPPAPRRSDGLTDLTAIAFLRRPAVTRTIERHRFTSFVTPSGVVVVEWPCSRAAQAVSDNAINTA
jgi:hypothetical protein